MHKHPLSLSQLRHVPSQFSWVDQRLVRAPSIDHLSAEACALSLFLITVADAQGLSYDADGSLGQRLSLSRLALSQARQALITQGLVAYKSPLSQVLALGETHRADTARPKAHAEEIDIKARFAPIWEIVS